MPFPDEAFLNATDILRTRFLGISHQHDEEAVLETLRTSLTGGSLDLVDEGLVHAACRYLEGDSRRAQASYLWLVSPSLSNAHVSYLVLRLLTGDADQQNLFIEFGTRAARLHEDPFICRLVATRLLHFGEHRASVEIYELTKEKNLTDAAFIYSAYEELQDHEAARAAMRAFLDAREPTYLPADALPPLLQKIANLPRLGDLAAAILEHLQFSKKEVWSEDTVELFDRIVLKFVDSLRDEEAAIALFKEHLLPDDSDEAPVTNARRLLAWAHSCSELDLNSISWRLVHRSYLLDPSADAFSAMVDIALMANEGDEAVRLALSHLATVPRNKPELVARSLLWAARHATEFEHMLALRDAAIEIDPKMASDRRVEMLADDVRAAPFDELKEQHDAQAIRALWNEGRPSAALVEARRLVLEEHNLPASLALVVDLLIEAGSHGRAYELAWELGRMFPSDPAVEFKIAMVATWLNDRKTAIEYGRRASRLTSRRILVLPGVLEWVANYDREYVRETIDRALAMPKFAPVHDELQRIRVTLSAN